MHNKEILKCIRWNLSLIIIPCFTNVNSTTVCISVIPDDNKKKSE
jgi:hypothetical protein